MVRSELMRVLSYLAGARDGRFQLAFNASCLTCLSIIRIGGLCRFLAQTDSPMSPMLVLILSYPHRFMDTCHRNLTAHHSEVTNIEEDLSKCEPGSADPSTMETRLLRLVRTLSEAGTWKAWMAFLLDSFDIDQGIACGKTCRHEVFFCRMFYFLWCSMVVILKQQTDVLSPKLAQLMVQVFKEAARAADDQDFACSLGHFWTCNS